MKRPTRAEGALLAGVCAELSRRFGWNVWVLRALFLAGLVLKPLATAGVYLVLALVIGILLSRGGVRTEAPDELRSSVLKQRGERIAELERRFRELENDGS